MRRTSNELYYGFVTNTNLKPEYTNQYDLGVSYSKDLNGWLDYIALTVDAYYNNVINKIVYTPNPYKRFPRYKNFGKGIDIWGLDVNTKTQAKISNNYKALLSMLSYSYQLAFNVTDPTSPTYLNQLPYIPQHTLAINAGISRGAIGVYYNQLVSSSRF